MQHAAECVEELLNSVRENQGTPWFEIVERKMDRLAKLVDREHIDQKAAMAGLMEETLGVLNLYTNVPERNQLTARWEILKKSL